MCALSRPLTCACSLHGAKYQVAASPQQVGVCHHHTQQQQQQQRDQLERDHQRPSSATNAELSAGFKSTTSATTTGYVEQHELATEV